MGILCHTFFVATDEDLEALFPGWVAPGSTRVDRERVDPYRGSIDTVATTQPAMIAEPPRSPSFRDDVWGPPVAPIKRGVDGETFERLSEPGLLALPHYCCKDAGWFISPDHLIHQMLDTEAPGSTPCLRLGPDDDEMAIVAGFSAEDALALASCEDERLDALAWELLAEESDEDEVEVEGEHWVHVRQALRALRALARKATKRRAHVGVYVTL